MPESSIPAIEPALAEKERALLGLLAGYGRVAVAFSAGIDSTLVAAAAARACGERAVAVTAVSASLPSGEWDAAVELARLIGIRHQRLDTDEFADPNYVANPHNRCYFCKTELYTQLQAWGPKLDVDVIVNGATLDDQGDHRPGMRAATEFRVRSPLIEAGFRKADVRALAQHWGLPNWDKPASPCLASRIAYGLEVTPERVTRVDAAERFLRELLNERELRVRHEFQDLARIELPPPALARAVQADLRTLIAQQLKQLGFRSVTIDLEGFRSGSLNAVIPLESLRLRNHR